MCFGLHSRGFNHNGYMSPLFTVAVVWSYLGFGMSWCAYVAPVRDPVLRVVLLLADFGHRGVRLLLLPNNQRGSETKRVQCRPDACLKCCLFFSLCVVLQRDIGRGAPCTDWSGVRRGVRAGSVSDALQCERLCGCSAVSRQCVHMSTEKRRRIQ